MRVLVPYILLLWVIVGMFAMAQTRISPDQRIPVTPVAVEWGVCQGSGTRPGGDKWNCVNMELMRFRMSNGTTKLYMLIPATPEIAADAKFVRVPLN